LDDRAQACGGGEALGFIPRLHERFDRSASNAPKCARKGRYSVRRLIEKHGRKANMMKCREQLNGDCLKRDAHSMMERCDLICPDLPEVL